MNTHTKRRKRHRANAILKFGKSAVRKHMRKSGRTGGIWKKRTHGKHAAQADTHRMVETGTGSGRSLSGTVAEGDAPNPTPSKFQSE